MSYSATCTAIIPVPDNHHSGPSSKCYIVQHDIECPPGKGWARSLASSYMQNPATQASIHYIIDAADVVGTLDETFWAWGSGSPSSQHGIHIEQAGYASFSRAQWLGLPEAVGSTYQRPNGSTSTFTAQDASDMAAQFGILVALWVDICNRFGWEPEAANQAQLEAEVQGANLGKHIRHVDASNWVGGTVHYDPGTGYPWPDLLAAVHDAMHNDPDPTPPTPDPDDIWEYLMTLPDAPKTWAQARKDIANEVAKMLAVDPKSVERAVAVANNRIKHAQNYDGTRVGK